MKIGDTVQCGLRKGGKVLSVRASGDTAIVKWSDTGEQLEHQLSALKVQEEPKPQPRFESKEEPVVEQRGPKERRSGFGGKTR